MAGITCVYVDMILCVMDTSVFVQTQLYCLVGCWSKSVWMLFWVPYMHVLYIFVFALVLRS